MEFLLHQWWIEYDLQMRNFVAQKLRQRLFPVICKSVFRHLHWKIKIKIIGIVPTFKLLIIINYGNYTYLFPAGIGMISTFNIFPLNTFCSRLILLTAWVKANLCFLSPSCSKMAAIWICLGKSPWTVLKIVHWLRQINQKIFQKFMIMIFGKFLWNWSNNSWT